MGIQSGCAFRCPILFFHDASRTAPANESADECDVCCGPLSHIRILYSSPVQCYKRSLFMRSVVQIIVAVVVVELAIVSFFVRNFRTALCQRNDITLKPPRLSIANTAREIPNCSSMMVPPREMVYQPAPSTTGTIPCRQCSCSRI
jgi:hypothetical protein